jgi:hypothetical protein
MCGNLRIKIPNLNEIIALCSNILAKTLPLFNSGSYHEQKIARVQMHQPLESSNILMVCIMQLQ